MQAYTQALLGDKTPGSGVGPDGGVPCKVHVTTWVTLPPECRPKTKDGKDLWFQMGIRDPVVPLVRALYGHPDAGGTGSATVTPILLSVALRILIIGLPCSGTRP